MTARTPGPAARLLIAPVLFIALLVAGLQFLLAQEQRPVDERLRVDAADLPPLVDDVVRCERERPDTEPAQREAERIATGARVSSAAIVACPQAFDGRRVTYAGEIVGDVLRRDGGGWVQVNDDDYALEVGPLPAHDDLRGSNSGLQVWIPDDLIDGLEPGRPGRRGDVVQVDGVLLRADPDDAGGMTLRADALQVHATAVDVDVPVGGGRVVLAAAASALALALWALRRRARE